MTLGVVLVLALAADGDGGAAAPSLNLLHGAPITRSEGLTKGEVLADGIASTDGDVWDSPRSAILKAGGVVEWDLLATHRIGAMRIQADNNDRYLIFGSADGTNWVPIWFAQPVDLPGVQTRTSPDLQGVARFLRMTAEGGDSLYSISELEVFESTQALRLAALERIAPPPPPPPPPAPPFDTGLLVVGGVAALGVAYFFWASRQPRPPV